MGLDQFAYRVKKGFIKEPVDFRTEQYNEETKENDILCDKKELHYWRKHPHLQGWRRNSIMRRVVSRLSLIV